MRRTPVTNDSVHHATDLSKQYAEEIIRQALRLAADPEKDTRLTEGLCLTCYYLRQGQIGGAAMTSRACGVCETVTTYGSTVTDALCRPCASKHELCRQCGGDLYQRVRRKWVPPAAEPPGEEPTP